MKIVELNYKDLKLYIFNKKSETNDIKYIKKRKDEIFQILKESYAHIDGCYIYTDPDDMIDKAGRYKIVMDSNQNIYSVATYRHFKKTNSYKCILIGYNHSLDATDGKTGVQWIIKSDIINWKNLYWIEAFDAVAHWHEKYGAFKIPSVYVPAILGKAGIKLDENDDYKYYRLIQGHDDPKPKFMFGFDSEERVKMLLKDELYLEYEKTITDLYKGIVDDSIFESHQTTNRLEAVLNTLYFIEDRYNEQMQFRNITKNTLVIMSKAYKEGMKIAKTEKIDPEQKEELLALCRMCKKIAYQANILDPHKLFVK